jgi:L-galactose dehydrogenase
MIELNTISRISIGCAGFGNEYEEMDFETARQIINIAIHNGINYFDTAPFYGETRSEIILGKCIENIYRETFFISTKVGRQSVTKFNYSYNYIIKSVNESLKRLNLNNIDLVQCHDIEFCDSLDIILNETLPALEQLKKEYKLRYIGITGLHLEQLDYVVTNSKVKIDAVLVYCTYNLFNTTLDNYSKKWKKLGITIIQGGVTAMGLLTNQGPRDWHPASNLIKNTCKNTVDYCINNDINITEIAFKFVYNNTDINSILIGVTNLEQLYEYLDWVRNNNSDNIETIQEKLKIIKNMLWIEN